jgi:hypothetical protein
MTSGIRIPERGNRKICIVNEQVEWVFFWEFILKSLENKKKFKLLDNVSVINCSHDSQPVDPGILNSGHLRDMENPSSTWTLNFVFACRVLPLWKVLSLPLLGRLLLQCSAQKFSAETAAT